LDLTGQDLPVYTDAGALALVLGVEMDRLVLSIEHPDHYAKKGVEMIGTRKLYLFMLPVEQCGSAAKRDSMMPGPAWTASRMISALRLLQPLGSPSLQTYTASTSTFRTTSHSQPPPNARSANSVVASGRPRSATTLGEAFGEVRLVYWKTTFRSPPATLSPELT
jgi:hypothetical protein